MREKIIEDMFAANDNYVSGLTTQEETENAFKWILELYSSADKKKSEKELKETILDVFQCSPIFEDWMSKKECQDLSEKLAFLREKCRRFGLSDILEKRISCIFQFHF